MGSNPNKLRAYHGGSGLWSVVSANGKRSYNVEMDHRGNPRYIRGRAGFLNLTGPTAQEVLRAIARRRAEDAYASTGGERGELSRP